MSDQLYGCADMPTVNQPMLKRINVIGANKQYLLLGDKQGRRDTIYHNVRKHPS